MAEAGVVARAAAANGMAEAAEVGQQKQQELKRRRKRNQRRLEHTGPKPANWGSMTKARRESWKKHTQALAKGKR